jgi:HNH endonuclease
MRFRAVVYNATFNQRFWAKVNMTVGCWLWTGKRIGPMKYGALSNGRNHFVYAHRYAYEYANGKIPEGLCVLHRCDVPHCVNPSHLFVGTQQQNTLDMIAKGRHITPFAPNKFATHCVKGHEFTLENTIIRDRGRRRCRTCQNAAVAAYRRRLGDDYLALDAQRHREARARRPARG